MSSTPSISASYNVAMAGCFSSAAMRASRKNAREGVSGELISGKNLDRNAASEDRRVHDHRAHAALTAKRSMTYEPSRSREQHRP